MPDNIKKISRFVHSNAFFGVYLKTKPLIMLKQTLKYTLLPFFYSLTFLLFTGCGKEETNTMNHLPVADFVVDAYRGDVNTVFNFDAGMVSDVEDPVELLEIRWNFTNSGEYDTEYDTIKTASHQYAQTGLYFPLLKVRDTKGMIDSTTKMVVVVHNLDNQPPNKPRYITPVDWQNWIDPAHVFKWSCTDPESDTLSFDFWLGTRETNLVLWSENIVTTEAIENGKVVYSTTLSGLKFNRDYYWQVYAHDPNGNYTPGDIWKFTTSPEE